MIFTRSIPSSNIDLAISTVSSLFFLLAYSIFSFSYICPNCGVKTGGGYDANAKNKIIAIILAVFLGTFGVHNFYLGYISKGIAQLLLSTIGACIIIGPIITWVWVIVEVIMIATGSLKDAQGNDLV